MPSEWAEKYTLALAHREGFSQGQKAMIANALDASRAQGRREGLEEAIAATKDKAYGFAVAECLRARITQEPA